MDSTDVRIFCEMAFGGLSYDASPDRHVGPPEISRRLGLDEKTVRLRIGKMERSGFIKYYQAVPNLSLFGLKATGSYRFEALNLTTKFIAIERLHEVPRLVESADYLGPYLFVKVAGESLETVDETAKAFASLYELNRADLGRELIRESTAKLDGLDWRIISRLRYDAMAPTGKVSDDVSATPRMVSYRLSKLLRSGALAIRAVVDAKRQEGLVFYELEIATDKAQRSEVVRWLTEAFGEHLWALSYPAADVVIASLFGVTLGEPEASTMKALEEKGVRRCSLFVLKEVLEPKRSSWIDASIAQRMEARDGGLPLRTAAEG